MSTFSRLLLNPNKRSGRKLMLDPQSMHAAVRSAFPPDLDERNGRVLWRVDSQGHEHVLYIVAPEAPEAEHLIDQVGWASRPIQVADYTPLLDRLQRGQEWQFRIRANPVHAVKGAADRGVVRPHVTVAKQTEWLLNKGEQHGFEVILADPDNLASATVAVTNRTDLSFARRDAATGSRGQVTLRTAQFDGQLRVTDREAFRDALVKGIGRGKAYGCGLMSLRRIGG